MSRQINKIMKELNAKKVTGPDKILPKIVRLSANIINSHLTNIQGSQRSVKSVKLGNYHGI